jgi:hypothetical protein
MAGRMPVIIDFSRQQPRPPRQRIYIDLRTGLRLLLDLPDVVRLSHAGIPAGPCRLSVYRLGRADFMFEQARVCQDPVDLARDGGELCVDLDVVELER